MGISNHKQFLNEKGQYICSNCNKEYSKDGINTHYRSCIGLNACKGRKISEKEKEKLSKSRKKYLKEHPEKLQWTLRGNQSYPSKMFEKFLKDKKFNENYQIIKERSEYPYYIDFAFENQMIGIEIDGKQHEWESNKNYDIERDKFLIEKGWTIFRIPASIINNFKNHNIIEQDIRNLLKDKNYVYEKTGIFSWKEIKLAQLEEKKNFIFLKKKQKELEYQNYILTFKEKLKEIDLKCSESKDTIKLMMKEFNCSHTHIVHFCKKHNLIINNKRHKKFHDIE